MNDRGDPLRDGLEQLDKGGAHGASVRSGGWAGGKGDLTDSVSSARSHGLGAEARHQGARRGFSPASFASKTVRSRFQAAATSRDSNSRRLAF